MDVAVIAYHSGDEYQNSYSTARLNYYAVGGFPTVKFDGVLSQSGASGNMYPIYLSKYNSRISIPSSFTIDAEGTNSGLVDYELSITVEKVATASTDNPILHVAVTESHIPDSWGGLLEVNYAERLMAPNASGTTLDFSTVNTENITINFSVNPDWVNENMELVIFLQNNSTKEVLQGIIRDLSDFETTNLNDAAVTNLITPKTVCNDVMVPEIILANYGLDNLTSVSFCVYVNDVATCTLPWTGNLAYLESEVVTFPEISFLIEPENVVKVEAENPNGQPDDYPSNNMYENTMDEAQNVVGPVTLIMLLGSNPEEITWEVKDSQGSVLYEGGPYTGSPPSVIQQFNLTDLDCYSFIIYDEGGDGLTGGGVFKLYDGNNSIFVQGNNYGFQDHVQFSIGMTSTNEMQLSQGFEVFPNPIEDKATISFVMDKPGEVYYQIYNSTGSLVKKLELRHFMTGSHTMTLLTEDLSKGMYIIEFHAGDKVLTKQIVIIK